MRAPGFGPLGFSIAMLAVGGVLVARGHDAPGLLLDVLGVVGMWAVFRSDYDD